MSKLEVRLGEMLYAWIIAKYGDPQKEKDRSGSAAALPGN